VYNTITCFSIIIGALALVAFCARFFGGVFLKRNNHLLTKKKNKLFIYFSFDATCNIRWSFC